MAARKRIGAVALREATQARVGTCEGSSFPSEKAFVLDDRTDGRP